MSTSERELAFPIDQIDTANLKSLVGILDLQATLPGIQRLRAWVHAALAVRPGERAIDIGSGTGTEVQVFATAAGPTGDAVGVEPNPGTRGIAEQRARENGSSARFVAGEAAALPFEDASVDVVRSERLFQHLHEPERAVAEVARVLRPGGRALIVDPDWGTLIVHPGSAKVLDAVVDAALTTFLNPFSGRRLAGQLTAAGLQVTDVGSEAIVFGQQNPENPLLRDFANVSVGRGVISAVERDDFFAELRQAAAVGDFHMSMTMFAVLARRPKE